MRPWPAAIAALIFHVLVVPQSKATVGALEHRHRPMHMAKGIAIADGRGEPGSGVDLEKSRFSLPRGDDGHASHRLPNESDRGGLAAAHKGFKKDAGPGSDVRDVERETLTQGAQGQFEISTGSGRRIVDRTGGKLGSPGGDDQPQYTQHAQEQRDHERELLEDQVRAGNPIAEGDFPPRSPLGAEIAIIAGGGLTTIILCLLLLVLKPAYFHRSRRYDTFVAWCTPFLVLTWPLAVWFYAPIGITILLESW